MTLLGYITWYLYLFSSPLRCGGEYSPIDTPWIAMDIDAGHAVCGDRVEIIGEDGIVREFIVRDSGPLSDYCIRQSDGSCAPIIGDIPLHGVWWEGLSTRVTIVNVDMYTRTVEDSLPPDRQQKGQYHGSSYKRDSGFGIERYLLWGR